MARLSVYSPLWNTTRMAGPELAFAILRAESQEVAVLEIFSHNRNLSPSQVWRIGCDLGRDWLLTSVRRAMTNLTTRKDLVKLETKVDGAYNRKEFVWSRNDTAQGDLWGAK